MNEKLLPISFFNVFLPFDEFSVNWLINFLHQFLLAFFFANLLFIHLAVTLILINHSCWSIDILISSVEQLNHLSDDHDRENLFLDITKQLKEIVEKGQKAMDWQKDTQEYLKFLVLMEFSLLSFLLCGFMYIIIMDPKASTIVYVAQPVMMFQLFIYCWFGTRVLRKIEQFVAQIYNVKWYSMSNKHRKDIQFILVMAQSMKGYNGIFNEMNMITFVKVC